MHFEDEFDVIFVGAGISVNPPTCFPMAGSIISRILRAIAPNENVLANLEILSNSERTEKRNPGDSSVGTTQTSTALSSVEILVTIFDSSYYLTRSNRLQIKSFQYLKWLTSSMNPTLCTSF